MTTNKIERWNSITHFIGALLGVLFTILMTMKSIYLKDTKMSISFLIYGLCFTFMFSSSAIYHGLSNKRTKDILRTLDHTSIFIFIAGSYTPVLTLLFHGKFRVITLLIIWSICLAGITLKIITFGKYNNYKRLSTLIYIIMGWMAIFIIKPLYHETGFGLFFFIVVGGLLYTVGTYFYRKEDLLYHHVIWHFFVLAGALVHFIGYILFL